VGKRLKNIDEEIGSILIVNFIWYADGTVIDRGSVANKVSY
jgi:hypothetical protein